MTINVEFEFYFGTEDNRLFVQADVTLGQPEHSGASVAMEDATPAEPDEVEFTSIKLLEDEDGGDSEVEFHTGGVYYYSRVSSKPVSLEEMLIEQAINMAAE